MGNNDLLTSVNRSVVDSLDVVTIGINLYVTVLTMSIDLTLVTE